MAWLSISAQNIVILILLLALTVKFIFFEDKNNVVVNKQHDEEKKLITKKKEKKEHDDSADRDNTNTIGTDMSVIEAVFPPCGEWIENPVERANKEIQTDAIYLSTSNSNDESELLKKFEIPRSLEDCIEIYKSKVRLPYRTIFNSVLFVISQNCMYVCRQCFLRKKIILVMLGTSNTGS
jgi:hydroxymethylglutaryl-CoA reductase (NADPH)